MDVALEPVNHLNRLPDELILEIIEQPCLSVCDLFSLACTSRRHYGITISPAYKAHVERQYGFAIYWAIENEQHRTLKRLVEHGVDVNMRESDSVPFNFQTFISLNNFHMNAHKLIEKLDYQDLVSPLAWAASHGRDSMVEYLLDHGADIEQKSSGLCADYCTDRLLYCPYNLPKIPEFREGDDHSRCIWWTPLHYAICKQKPSTAQLLLERGANALNVDESDSSCPQVTALHVATCCGSHDTVNYLLDKDLFDINAQDKDGATVLHLAYLTREYDLVNKFLDRGADINLAYDDQTGPWTVFAMACAEGLFGQALEYLRRGADPHFVLEDDDRTVKFTVMRLIYSGDSKLDSEDLDRRIELEQEIIARGRPSPSDT